MNRVSTLEHEFVDGLPDELVQGVLYVSMPFATAAHLCCCGCGNQVFTPLRPNRWRLTFDGEAISLYPSVGNWNFSCESHYWIVGSKVRWAPTMTRREVAVIREQARAGQQLIESGERQPVGETEYEPHARRLFRWLLRR